MRVRALVAIVAVALFSQSALAVVNTPSIFGSHMVLQVDQPLPVWGTATAGKTITVAIAGQVKTAMADARGKWRVLLDPIRTTGTVDMHITGDGQRHFTDVLIGEVWLCSGQSNMGLPMSSVNNAEEEIAAANHPTIRLFTAANTAKETPQEDVEGRWTVCTPATVRGFSAAAYFFGRDLQQAIKVPVGLVHSSWGGTPCESWMPTAALAGNAITQPILDGYAKAVEALPATMTKYQAQAAAYHGKFDSVDPGPSPVVENWAATDMDDKSWTPLDVKGFRERTSRIDGAFWFRNTIDIPAAWANRPLRLNLGRMDDYDVTFFDGKQVGATGAGAVEAGKQSRIYTIPADQVKSGRVAIAVRLFDRIAGGSFGMVDGEGMSIGPVDSDDTETMNISTGWKTADEFTTVQRSTYPDAPRAPVGPNHSKAPANLYNGMILPLAPYAIRGVIWYQGETNAARGKQYRTLLPALVTTWRELWNQPTNKAFPFYIVQLASFHKAATRPVEPSDWSALREAQNLSAKAIGNSGVAVTIDIGDANDIHPKNKQDVGKRLAALALHNTYGRADVVPSGPVFREMKIERDCAILGFDVIGGGLIASGDKPLGGFALAGADRVWHAAKATVTGDTLTVRCDAVNAPVAVRYGWADNPVSANLYNAAGLPASPFRTDDWPDNVAGSH